MEELHIYCDCKQCQMQNKPCRIEYCDDEILKDDAAQKVLVLIKRIRKVRGKLSLIDGIEDAISVIEDGEICTCKCKVFKGEDWKLVLVQCVGVFFEMDDGFYFKVYCTGHPEIICPDFQFGNSDGSTDNIEMDLEFSVKEILYRTCNIILEYCFNQIH